MKQLMATVVVFLILCGSVRGQDVNPIVAVAVIDAPVDAVWAAWTTADGLRAWLAPHVEFDLRLGGLMRTNYHAQGTLGDPQTIENVVLSFEPGRMLSMQVAKAPAKFPFPNAIYRMWTVLYLDVVTPGQTRVRVVGMGFSPDEESQKMRTFFLRGNATTLEQLQRHFAARR